MGPPLMRPFSKTKSANYSLIEMVENKLARLQKSESTKIHKSSFCPSLKTLQTMPNKNGEKSF
jgi:hypothetical protein